MGLGVGCWAGCALPGRPTCRAVKHVAFGSLRAATLLLCPAPSPSRPRCSKLVLLLRTPITQVVLETKGASAEPYRANPKLSITRVGTRAYYKALEELAPQVGGCWQLQWGGGQGLAAPCCWRMG